MQALLLTTMLCLGAPPAPDTVVVCPDEFRQTLEPWVRHRTQQGHQLAFVSSTTSAREIRAAIRETARSGKLRFVVLVGDADPAAARDAKLRAVTVPTHAAKAKVNIHWGSEPAIGTDNWYADLDDDTIPDVAIGRLTADTKEELALIVRKILDYENKAGFGIWRRKINVVAGVGGFGKVADAVLEMAAKKVIVEGIPTAYSTTMTYASWRSPYCPDPRRFHEATMQRLNEGCLFWVYIGHGQRRYLDQVRVPGDFYHIMSTADMPKIAAKQGAPIALFLACYTGAFDEPKDCLAEEMLRTEGGPVAIFSGSRVTMPYAMGVMSQEMLRECFHERRETLGEVVMHAKRKLVTPLSDEDKAKLTTRNVIEMIAATISPSKELLEEERFEHLHLFNLIGDPLMRLHHPETVTVNTPGSATAGEPLTVRFKTPVAGRCTIELTCRRDGLRFTPPRRPEFDPSNSALAAYDATYSEANNPSWLTRTFDITPEHASVELTTKLQIPAEARGICHIRIHVEGQETFAVGSSRVVVQQTRRD